MCDRRILFLFVLSMNSCAFSMNIFGGKKQKKPEKERMIWEPTEVQAQLSIVATLLKETLPNDPKTFATRGNIYLKSEWFGYVCVCIERAQEVFLPAQAQVVIRAMLENLQLDSQPLAKFLNFLSEKASQGDGQAKHIAALISKFVAQDEVPVLEFSNTIHYGTMLNSSFSALVEMRLQEVAQQRAMEID